MKRIISNDGLNKIIIFTPNKDDMVRIELWSKFTDWVKDNTLWLHKSEVNKIYHIIN